MTLNGSCSVAQESKQQILQPLSVLRPKFRVSFISGYSDWLLWLFFSGYCSVTEGYSTRILAGCNPSTNTSSRILFLSRKNLNDYYWIMIVFFLPWASLLVFGDEQGRYTKETESFQNLSESMDIWCGMSVQLPFPCSCGLTLPVGTSMHLWTNGWGIGCELLGGKSHDKCSLIHVWLSSSEIWPSRIRLHTEGCSHFMRPAFQTTYHHPRSSSDHSQLTRVEKTTRVA